MKKSKFTDSQILSILKQAEGGADVSDLCREHVISSATFYNVASQVRWNGCIDDITLKRA